MGETIIEMCIRDRSFDAKYNYDDIAMENDVDLVDIYKEWQKEWDVYKRQV